MSAGSAVPKKLPGRPWNQDAQRGTCVEINELARLLREWMAQDEVTGAALLRQLTADHFTGGAVPSRNKVYNLLAGKDLHEQLGRDLAEAVVDICSLNASVQSERLAIVRRLWMAARDAPTALALDRVLYSDLVAVQQKVIDKQDQLERLRHALHDSDGARRQAEQIMVLLIGLLGRTQQQVVDLARERDRLKRQLTPGQAGVLRAYEHRLEQAKAQQADTEAALQGAHRDRTAAQQVADQAARTIHRLEEEIARLRTQHQAAFHEKPAAEDAPVAVWSAPVAADADDAMLQDTAATLHKANALLAQGREAVEAAQEEIGAAAPEPGDPGEHRIILGTEVHDSGLSQTTPDNPTTGPPAPPTTPQPAEEALASHIQSEGDLTRASLRALAETTGYAGPLARVMNEVRLPPRERTLAVVTATGDGAAAGQAEWGQLLWADRALRRSLLQSAASAMHRVLQKPDTALAERARSAEGRPVDGLYQGSALAAASQWAGEQGHRDVPDILERAFRTAPNADWSARWSAEHRRLRRGYQLVSTLVVLVLIAVGAGLYAWQVASSADHQAQVALSRQIAGAANRLRVKDPALAAQLALTSYRVAPSEDARSALLNSSATATPRRTHAAQGTATVMASAGALLAMGTDTGQVQLWRTSAAGPPTRISTALRAGHSVAALTLSGDGTVLAASDQAGAVSAWRINDPAHPMALPVPSAHSGRVSVLAFSPDDKLLAAGTGTALTYLWHLGTGSPPIALKGPQAAVKGVVFSPNGHVLAVGGEDRTVHLWDVSVAGTPLPLPSLAGPADKIFAIAISPDSRTLAAGAADHAAYIWDIADPDHPKPLGRPLTGPAGWVKTVAFSPDGATLAGGSSDTLLWRWDLRSRQVIGTLPHPAPLTAVTYRDGHTLDTLASDGFVRTWNLPGPTLTGSTQRVLSLSFNAAGTRLLVGAGDGSLHLWDVADRLHPLPAGPLMANPLGPAQLAGAAVLTPDGATAIGGATDGTISLFDVADPRHPVSLGPPMQITHRLIESITVSHDGRTAAVSSDDGVHLIDISDPARPVAVAALTGSTGTALGVGISPDGHILAVAGADAKGYLWDIADRAHPRLLTTVTGFNGAVYAVTFSPDGKLAAFGAADHSVRLVELESSQAPVPIATPLIGPVGEIYDLTFDPATHQLAISSIDGTIWLWDIHDPGKPDVLAILQATSGGLFAVTFSPDGRTLAAGGSGNVVQLWDTGTASVASWICKNTGDPITPSEWSQFIPGQPYDPPCP